MKSLAARLVALGLAAATLAAWAPAARADSLYPTVPLALHAGPGDIYPSQGLVPEGAATHLLERKGNWFHISLADGRDGWVQGAAARIVFDQQTSVTTLYEVVAHADATWYSQAVSKVPGGTVLAAQELKSGYYLVTLPNGQQGWVDETQVQAPQSTPGQSGTVKALGSKHVQILARGTAVRVGRAPDYDTVDYLDPSDSDGIQYLGAREGWIQVITPSGRQGWINGAQVLLSDAGDFNRQMTYDIAEGRYVMAYKPVAQVIPSDGLNLRQGPSTATPILAAYPAGTLLRVLQTQGNWQRVQAADGRIGWVDGTFTAVLPGGPLVQRVYLHATDDATMQLEIWGNFGAGVSVTGDPSHGSLTVGVADSGAYAASLPVGEHGVSTLQLGQQGVSLGFGGTFAYKVLDNSKGHVLVELSPQLMGVSYIKGSDDRRTFRFAINGEINAQVHREGPRVILDLPGATMQSVTPPPGMAVWAVPGGLRAQVTTTRAFELKRRAGQLDLVFHSATLAGKTIVIDPGHGGTETGAIGPAGLYEKNSNLGIGLALRDLLTAQGATVIMTRTGDTRTEAQSELNHLDSVAQLRYDLNNRTVIANQHEADLFISIHGNGGPASAHGTETYFCSGNFNAYQSHRLAGLIQGSLQPTLGTLSLGVGDEDFYVVKFTEAPAVLVETAFVTNPTEEALLRSSAYQAKVARGILPGIQRFFAQDAGQ